MRQKTVYRNNCRFKAKKMDATKDIIFSSFFSGKFSPPRIDPNFHFFRKGIINQLQNSDHRVISIEARAGQGKTIVAAQFLKSIKANYAWLQLFPADRDPVIFITALFAALIKAFPELTKSSVYEMISKDEIIAQEANRLVPTLIKDLIPLLKEDFYLVIDDLHLLKDSVESLSAIESFIRNASSKLRFILISRSSLDIGSIFKNALRLDNTSLALSRSDIAELFAKTFKTPLPVKIVRKLHQNTEGWIMGLILASHVLTNTLDSMPSVKLNNLSVSQPNKIWDYFHSEILSSLSVAARRNLLCLSLLDDIPLSLAESLSLMPDIYKFLEYLVHKNFFLRRIEDAHPSYCFHHLFQEFLKNQALKELSEKEQRVIWAKSGHWNFRQNRFKQALHYYLKAQSYAMVERILQKVGMQLKAVNRIAITVETLKTIPPEIVKTRAWLSLTAAAVYSTIDPPQSEEYLYIAYKKFISQKNEFGEMLTLAALISYHVGIDCNFRQGKKFLPRAESLYALLEERFSVADQIHIASSIAYGLCFFEGQFERAAQYTDKIIQMANEQGLYDAMAMGVGARGLVCTFDGDWYSFQKLIEGSLFLLQSDRVNNINKMTIIALQMNVLAAQGDLVAFNHYRNLISLWLDPKLISKTFFGAMLVHLDVNTAIAQGRLEDAKKYLQRSLESDGSNLSTHMQSIYWGRYANVFALQKDSQNALEAIQKSSELRKKVGGKYFEISNKIDSGSIHTILGNFDVAEDFLSCAITESKILCQSSYIISAYVYRAFVRFKKGKTSDALQDLKIFLGSLKKFQYPYFQNFNIVILQELLTTALLHNIEAEEVQTIAKKFLQTTILETGEHIPLLRINTLGILEIRMLGVVKIKFEDLTKTQRELLALLISASSEKGIPYSDIQEAFWPDIAIEKARSNMDNLFNRIRKVFNNLLAPFPANHYLSVKKGYVYLQNCFIDADIFKNDVQQGIRHVKRNEFWQASNAFLRAYSLYKGEFIPGVILNDPAAYLRENLKSHFVECSIHLAQLLSTAGRGLEAIQICQKALVCDPSNEPLVKFLCRLFYQNNDTVQAKKVITKYMNVLKEDGFSVEEIEDITNNLEALGKDYGRSLSYILTRRVLGGIH